MFSPAHWSSAAPNYLADFIPKQTWLPQALSAGLSGGWTSYGGSFTPVPSTWQANLSTSSAFSQKLPPVPRSLSQPSSIPESQSTSMGQIPEWRPPSSSCPMNCLSSSELIQLNLFSFICCQVTDSWNHYTIHTAFFRISEAGSHYVIQASLQLYT